jgi:predicted transposase/invertase (TIGR01784 family)
MRRDSIFYKIFQQSPELFFSLLPQPPSVISGYRFESVEVKETSFRIDGLFLPPDPLGLLYILEVQFQPDQLLYERLLSEFHLYAFRYRDTFQDWRCVVIYPSRSIEQPNLEIVADAIATGRLHRIYLDEIGPIEALPVGPALMVLTTLESNEAAAQARRFIQENPGNQAILDLVSTIMVYKFTNLSRDEVNAMIGIELTQTRVYQEAFAEGEAQGRAEGETQGRAEGEAEATRALVSRQLRHKLTSLKPTELQQLDRLSLVQLEALSEALLDFNSVADLQAWLNNL